MTAAIIVSACFLGALAVGGRILSRAYRPSPELECIACGHKGFMGELAPGKPCCAPCRGAIYNEVEGRPVLEPWQTPEAEHCREVQRDTQAELARHLQNMARRQIADADAWPKSAAWSWTTITYQEADENDLPFVAQAQARKERS